MNLLQIPNTESNSVYANGCKVVGLKTHPARFPAKLPQFFIKLLTDPGDIVLDIFAGSNTTGQTAEQEKRRWLSFEERIDYVASSAFRFFDKNTTDAEFKLLYEKINNGYSLQIQNFRQSFVDDNPDLKINQNKLFI